MGEGVTWIDWVPEESATDDLKTIYGKVRRADGSVHNLYRALSLFPSVIEAADQLYRTIMHAPDSPLEPWLRELVSVQVAILGQCDYALAHHGENFRRLSGDREWADAVTAALQRDEDLEHLLDNRVLAMLKYSAKLATAPSELRETDLLALREQGISDLEILHVNQISANFAYWVRVVNGLGIRLGSEKIGLGP